MQTVLSRFAQLYTSCVYIYQACDVATALDVFNDVEISDDSAMVAKRCISTASSVWSVSQLHVCKLIERQYYKGFLYRLNKSIRTRLRVYINIYIYILGEGLAMLPAYLFNDSIII